MLLSWKAEGSWVVRLALVPPEDVWKLQLTVAWLIISIRINSQNLGLRLLKPTEAVVEPHLHQLLLDCV